MRNIPYAKHDITENDVDSVTSVLKSGFLTGGENVVLFEENFRKYVQSEYALSVSSGTAGLHLAVKALGIPKDKFVLLPSLTFAATANAVLYSGGNIEFIDIDPQTLLMDINIIEKRLLQNPDKYAGIITVDYAGLPSDVIKLKTICDKYKLWLIEDAAHSLGGVLNDDLVGNAKYSDITVFSFHPAKHITTGEGGMITTNNPKLYEKIKLSRSHNMDRSKQQSSEEGWYYEIDDVGYNYRMSDINASLGNSQLSRINENLSNRRRLADRYTKAFENNKHIKLQSNIPNGLNAYHLYTTQVKNRKGMYDYLKSKGIYAQVHYVPLHMQPAYAKYFNASDSPLTNTENYYAGCLSIPMFPTLSLEDQDYVIGEINNFLNI